MNPIPLEPRGRFRPRPWIVRLSEVLLGWGLGGYILRLLDTVGRGESAMDIYNLLPHLLGFIGHPAFSAVLIFVGFGMLWIFAKGSERASVSQLVHPVTKLPLINPIYPAFRRAVWTLAVSLLVSLAIWSFYKTSAHSYVLDEPLPSLSARAPKPPEEAWEKPPVYNDASLEIIYNHHPLNGQSLFANKDSKTVAIGIQLHNSGTSTTAQSPSSRLYLSQQCSPYTQMWQLVASDEAEFPAEFYLGQTGLGSVAPLINGQETWSWPELDCVLAKELTEPISGKIKVFYGGPGPSEARFMIRKQEETKPTSR
jgi:hypothetical protein